MNPTNRTISSQKLILCLHFSGYSFGRDPHDPGLVAGQRRSHFGRIRLLFRSLKTRRKNLHLCQQQSGARHCRGPRSRRKYERVNSRKMNVPK